MTFLDHILRNPYYRTGAVLAKQATNGSTLFWAMLVLIYDNAIGRTGYSEVVAYVHEDAIAAFLGVISLAQLVWLAAKWKPVIWGSFGYAVQCGWWFLVCALVAQQHPPHVTALTGTSLMATLAAFAFVSGKREDGEDDGWPA